MIGVIDMTSIYCKQKLSTFKQQVSIKNKQTKKNPTS